MNICFLDIDGVLNCQTYFEDADKREKLSFVENHFCKERVSWLNELCKDLDIKIVLSSTWRLGRTLDEIKTLFLEAGITAECIGKTPNLRHEACLRGNEIYQWIKENEELVGSEYHTYVIIDDDSDMLLWQKDNFFQTDNYSGLTPNTCYKIKKFFEKYSIYS